MSWQTCTTPGYWLDKRASYFTWSSTPDGDGCHYYVGLDVDYVGGAYDTYNNLYVSCVR